MSQENLENQMSQPSVQPVKPSIPPAFSSLSPVNSNRVELIKKIETGIPKLLKEVSLKAKINRFWDLGLTIASICLTLGITVSGLLGEEVVGKNQSKILAGSLGALLVAIQSTSRSIPIKQRSGGYRVLEAQLINLEFEFMFMQNNDGKLDDKEIDLITSKLFDLRKEAARLEQDPSSN